MACKSTQASLVGDMRFSPYSLLPLATADPVPLTIHFSSHVHQYSLTCDQDCWINLGDNVSLLGRLLFNFSRWQQPEVGDEDL